MEQDNYSFNKYLGESGKTPSGNRIGLNKAQNELDIYLGKPLRIVSQGKTAMGILEKISSEYLSLRPSLINEGLYDNNDKLVDNFILQKDLPQKVRVQSILNIEPLSEGYFEKLVKNLKEVSKINKKEESKEG